MAKIAVAVDEQGQAIDQILVDLVALNSKTDAAISDLSNLIDILPEDLDALIADLAAVDQALIDAQAARDQAQGIRDETEAYKDSTEAAKNVTIAARDQAQSSALSAESSSGAALGYAEAADTASSDAGVSATAAAASATIALAAQDDAQGAASAASVSANSAAASSTSAGASAAAALADRQSAETARSGSEAARDIAVTARQDAQTAASTATTQAGISTSAATNAETSATAAAVSASAALSSASDAEQSAAASNEAKLDAETARSQAQSAQTNAANSATSAGASESSASTSAINAANSASAAGASATSAATNASTASTAASNAETSANAANASRVTAETAASNAGIARDQAVTARDSANDAAALAGDRLEVTAAITSQGTSVLDDQFLAVNTTQSWTRTGSGGSLTRPDNTVFSIGTDWRFVVASGQTDGLHTRSDRAIWRGAKNADAYIVEVDFTLESGNIDGAGIWFDWADTSGTILRSAIRLDEASAGPVVAGEAMTARALVMRPGNLPSAFQSIRVWVYANRNDLSLGNAAKTISFHRVSIRAATDSETKLVDVEAAITQESIARVNADAALATSINTVQSNLDGTNATVSQQASAISTLEGNAAAVLALRVKAGTGGAALELVAADGPDGPASTARVSASDIILNGSVTATELAASSVDATKIDVQSLSAVSALIGLLRSKTSGERVEIEDDRIRVFDSNNVVRVVIGDLS
ncbi:hypothetical protein [Roseinatronobacter sp. NSM]|uniref:hypothetical protein n=1 Tax=Roseinatronobacter sp. NSM TaxID=3457785 RepID=UPI00403586B7